MKIIGKVRTALAAGLGALMLAGPAKAQAYLPEVLTGDPVTDAVWCENLYNVAVVEGLGLNNVEILARVNSLSTYTVGLSFSEMLPPMNDDERIAMVQMLQICEETFAAEPAFNPPIDFGYLAPAAAPEPALPDPAEMALTCAERYYLAGGNYDVEYFNRYLGVREHFGLDHDTVVFMADLMRDVFNDSPADYVASNLFYCDELYGFTPMTQIIDGKPAIPQISDWDCAIAYWLLGAFQTDYLQISIARAEFAAGLYLMDNPFEETAAVVQQIEAEARARGQLIQQGQQDPALLQAELTECEAKYGFDQTEGQ